VKDRGIVLVLRVKVALLLFTPVPVVCEWNCVHLPGVFGYQRLLQREDEKSLEFVEPGYHEFSTYIDCAYPNNPSASMIVVFAG